MLTNLDKIYSYYFTNVLALCYLNIADRENFLRNEEKSDDLYILAIRYL